ncbi:MAG: hypothetical protein A2X47_13415 [Lentisphaerae bacterium GWF2_38_69]|nr:MAG: hypothetical protein A2X47_13415 [Lentisphaerae bacterium GWF2_38_69]
MYEKLEAVLNEENPVFQNKDIKSVVSFYLDKRHFYLDKLKLNSLPAYIFEASILKSKADDFRHAFENLLPETAFYFAMKCNNHPDISFEMINNNYGLDVSSGLELDQALNLGCEDIVFSGPGKTKAEHYIALQNAGRVKILVDSFGELERLSALAEFMKVHIRIGVRLTTNPKMLWRKFGILPERIEEFYTQAARSAFVHFEGLQFHTSWNLNPSVQCEFIRKIGETLDSCSEECKKAIKFIDVGGGYWPEQGEWLHYETTNAGMVEKTIDSLGETTRKIHYRTESKPISFFAQEISNAIKQNIFSKISCKICFEPGRWICNDSMQLFMTVIDIKEPDIAITDAGTNTIGWDRFEYDYFPIINMTRPSLEEKSFNILGSLCTPHDVWGYNYFGEDLKEGDILMIPMQGAYTWSLRQQFIKPVASFIKT